MTLYNIAWLLWIVGTGLIILSWVSVVSASIGWAGFAIAGVGTLLSYLPRGRGNSVYPNSPEGNPVSPTGIWVTPETPLAAGSKVLAQSQGHWWRARVIAIESDDRVRVNYFGWDPNWVESHRRSQLQLDEDRMNEWPMEQVRNTGIQADRHEA